MHITSREADKLTDEDMTTSDTTKSTTHEYIYQVIYSIDSKIYYLIITNKITT
jgi:hypothetical protein